MTFKTISGHGLFRSTRSPSLPIDKVGVVYRRFNFYLCPGLAVPEGEDGEVGVVAGLDPDDGARVQPERGAGLGRADEVLGPHLLDPPQLA